MRCARSILFVVISQEVCHQQLSGINKYHTHAHAHCFSCHFPDEPRTAGCPHFLKSIWSEKLHPFTTVQNLYWHHPLLLHFFSRTVLNVQCLWSDFVIIRHSNWSSYLLTTPPSTRTSTCTKFIQNLKWL